MTKTEKKITETIARLIMDWTLDDSGNWKRNSDGWSAHWMNFPPHPCYAACDNHYFVPMSSEDACMTAWDTFTDSIRDLDREEPPDFEEKAGYIFTQTSGAERRKALCNYMVKYSQRNSAGGKK